jgi:hypothetical protein
MDSDSKIVDAAAFKRDRTVKEFADALADLASRPRPSKEERAQLAEQFEFGVMQFMEPDELWIIADRIRRLLIAHSAADDAEAERLLDEDDGSWPSA